MRPEFLNMTRVRAAGVASVDWDRIPELARSRWTGTVQRAATLALLLACTLAAQAQSPSSRLFSLGDNQSDPTFTLENTVAPSAVSPWAAGNDLARRGAVDADESPVQPAPRSNDEWKFKLAPYLWTLSIRADADIGSLATTTDLCFTDLVSDLNVAGQLRFEGLHGHWGFYLDGTYMRLSTDTKARVGPFRVRGVNASTTFTQGWLDFGGLYRFGEEGRCFDLMLGGRYVYLATDLSVGPWADGSISKDFLTLIVGARIQYAINDAWVLTLMGNVGGFDIGNDIDLTWGVTGLVGYRLNERSTIAIGYRYHDLQYRNGPVDINLALHGPILGFSYAF